MDPGGLPLFDDPAPEIEPESNQADSEVETSFERFVRFHGENPIVWRKFRAKCFRLWAVDIRSWGAWPIFGSLRYDHKLKTGGDDYKINNNYIGFYARLLMVKEPKFESFFNIREGCDGATDDELRAISVQTDSSWR